MFTPVPSVYAVCIRAMQNHPDCIAAVVLLPGRPGVYCAAYDMQDLNGEPSAIGALIACHAATMEAEAVLS